MGQYALNIIIIIQIANLRNIAEYNGITSTIPLKQFMSTSTLYTVDIFLRVCLENNSKSAHEGEKNNNICHCQ